LVKGRKKRVETFVNPDQTKPHKIKKGERKKTCLPPRKKRNYSWLGNLKKGTGEVRARVKRKRKQEKQGRGKQQKKS